MEQAFISFLLSLVAAIRTGFYSGHLLVLSLSDERTLLIVCRTTRLSIFETSEWNSRRMRRSFQYLSHVRSLHCSSTSLICRRVLVADVHARKGHIACDASTEAEIVVPLLAKGKTVGVLDLDSIGLSTCSLQGIS